MIDENPGPANTDYANPSITSVGLADAPMIVSTICTDDQGSRISSSPFTSSSLSVGGAVTPLPAPPTSFVPPTDPEDSYFYRLQTALDSIRIGMDVYSSLLIAEMSDEEIEYLDNDPSFAKKIRFEQNILERDLLVDLHSAIDRNVLHGKTAEVRWFLERFNKERWGSTLSVKADFDNLPNLVAKQKDD